MEDFRLERIWMEKIAQYKYEPLIFWLVRSEMA